MVAVESRVNGGGEPGSSCFLSYRGQTTKCALEHVRKGSSLEQISAGDWEEAIKEVIDEAAKDRVGMDEQRQAVALNDDGENVDLPQVVENQAVGLPAGVDALSSGELAEAMSAPPSRRSSLLVPETPGSAAAPGTPVQDLLSRVPRDPLQSRGFQQTLSRARSLDDAVAESDPRGLKRSASGPAEEMERGPPSAPFSSIPEVPGGFAQQVPPQLPEESRQPPEGPAVESQVHTGGSLSVIDYLYYKSTVRGLGSGQRAVRVLER